MLKMHFSFDILRKKFTIHAMDTNLKPIIARHFDYSTREKGGQYFGGEFFSPKHESSLEDLISDLEVEFSDPDEIDSLEAALAAKDEEIAELEKEITELEGEIKA